MKTLIHLKTLETVQYQPRKGNKIYNIIRISLYDVDHEYLAVTRNSIRISIILLFALAIDKFHNDILVNGIDYEEYNINWILLVFNLRPSRK